MYPHCDIRLTVQHIFVDCPKFAESSTGCFPFLNASPPSHRLYSILGNLLITSVSGELSIDIGSILLNTRYKAKNNTVTFLTNTYVQGLIFNRDGHKNLCCRRGSPDYVSFRRSVKRQLFHSSKNTTLQHFLTNS